MPITRACPPRAVEPTARSLALGLLLLAENKALGPVVSPGTKGDLQGSSQKCTGERSIPLGGTWQGLSRV